MIKVEPPQNVQFEGQIKSLQFYKNSKLKGFFYVVLCFGSFGSLYLMCRWYLRLWILFNLVSCQVLDADFVLVLGEDKSEELQDVFDRSLTKTDQRRFFKSFKYRYYSFYFDPDQQVFLPIQLNLNRKNYEILEEMIHGVVDAEQLQRLKDRYEENSTAIPDKGIINVLLDEILSPFYVFQMISLALWIYEEYIRYSIVLMIMSVMSVCETLYDYMKAHKKLQKIAHQEQYINVVRFCPELIIIQNEQLIINQSEMEGKTLLLNTTELVPGDIVEIQTNTYIPCDLILLNGQVIMNESMLTGESVPVGKTPLPYNNYPYKPEEEGKQHTLLAGTSCIEVRSKDGTPVFAVVTQTGFNTLKGSLIRSIVFSSENSFKFYSDSMKFIIGLAMFSVLEYFITLGPRIEQFQDGYNLADVIQSILDLVTIAVPPALPTCMQIGVSIGIWRLKKRQIYCISPQKINIAGKIKLMCFDKTGTLTEEGLDLLGLRLVHLKDNLLFFDNLVTDYEFKQQQTISLRLNSDLRTFEMGEVMRVFMASCQSLSIVNDQLIGDPLDIRMFEVTHYGIQDQNQYAQVLAHDQHEPVNIIKKFDFQSKLQRMSVVAEYRRIHFVFTKGSPEVIRRICQPETIPKNFSKTLEEYTQAGFRVIACGVKLYCEFDGKKTVRDDQIKEREEVENELTFLGFLILENKLKPVTNSVIEHLHSANIKTVMITGDNILTAISVAKQCNIIEKDHRVLYGDMFLDIDGSKQLRWRSCNPNEENYDQFKYVKQPDEKDEVQRILLSPSMDNFEELPFGSTDKLSLALTGQAFSYIVAQKLDTDLFTIVFQKSKVFARMKPEEKELLIKTYQKCSKGRNFIGFCGDGANDCQALKSADAGISLSLAEASIAAPFTSKVQDISCVPTLLLEGRAALTTSFNCFKFMVMYSVIESISVGILLFSDTSMTDGQFLVVDLFIILPLAVTMGLTGATDKLNKHVPKGSLISTPVIASVVGQSIIQTIFQVVAYTTLVRESWYIPADEIPDEYTDSLRTITYESTTVSLISNPQYLFLVVAFTTGKPFKKEFYTNVLFSLILLGLFIFVYTLFFFYKDPDDPFYDQFGYLFKTNKSSMPESWLFYLLQLSILNGFLTLSYERYIIPIISGYRKNLKEKEFKAL